ncbi:MAG: HAD family hydrolase [Candidatus Roizmanbacteria bacterium]
MTASFTKAIIFDLDGTTIKNSKNAKPSQKVVDAIIAAQAVVHTIFATGRNWKLVKDLAKQLNIRVPVVTLGGSQVIDPLTGKILWEQDLDPGIAEKVIEIAKTFPGTKIYDNDTNKSGSLKTYKIKPAMSSVCLFVDDKLVNEFVKQVKKIPLLLVETTPGWEKGMSEVAVKHIHATKFMALQTVAKKLGLNPKECVGVGDSGNDITLLNFCGTKIAMGNATDRLKELAHHIAPTVEEDGLAWVINTFILNTPPPPPVAKK